jgi:hypothetical protein
VLLDAFAVTYDDANQINEEVVGIPLDIHVDADPRSRHVRLTEHVNRPIANRQRLERMITQLERPIGSLASPTGSKCVSELGQRE